MADLILGTAGHIDHGKTALVKALTGTDTDRLQEEKARGITIELGFAELVADDLRFGVVDVPGHEAFVRSELTGESSLEITYDKDRLSAGQVLAILQEKGLRIEDVTTREADLEDVFVQLTGAG